MHNPSIETEYHVMDNRQKYVSRFKVLLLNRQICSLLIFMHFVFFQMHICQVFNVRCKSMLDVNQKCESPRILYCVLEKNCRVISVFIISFLSDKKLAHGWKKGIEEAKTSREWCNAFKLFNYTTEHISK